MFVVTLDCSFSSEDSTTAVDSSIAAAVLMVFVVELGACAILPDRAAHVAEFRFAYATNTINTVKYLKTGRCTHVMWLQPKLSSIMLLHR